MINPEAIDLTLLPSVSLQQRQSLPTTPCIYFAIDSQGVVQYIGKSINPSVRWVAHHRYSQLSQMEGVRIAYLQTDADLLSEVEAALIDWFSPSLNGLRTSREDELLTPIPGSSIRWRLRVLMAEQNISNQRLSELSGLHRVTISKLKKSDDLKQISGDTLNRLCNALKCTPNDLIEFKPDDVEVAV